MNEKRGRLDALLDVELVLAPTTDGRPRPTSTELAPGTVLGKYRLDRLLGAGGMGVVWDAHDTELDRRVAIKVLIRAGDAGAQARMVREARAMARLRHPNVITVFDAATLDGHDVIAMELIEGETLARWLERKPAPGEIVAMLTAAGRGLAAAHAAGLVHRDFKPHNVLVDTRGRAVVTDFGLARAVGEPVAPTAGDGGERHGALDSPLTATGTVLGTPAYMAPEQIDGRAADARADQFSYCVTLWEALAGRRPFPGETVPAIVAALAIGTPAEPERVPRRLRGLLGRGLSRDPDQRWPTIDALLDAITRAWRRPRRIAIACAAVVAVAAGAVVLHHVLARPRLRSWRPEIVDLPVFEENGDGIAISPDGETLAFNSDREQPDAFRVYLAPRSGGDPRPITPSGQIYQSPRWTRDGKALLLVHWDSPSLSYRVVKLSIAGGALVDLGPGVGADDCGDAIAIAEDDQREGRIVLRSSDGSRHVIVHAPNEYVLVPRCDASGQRIVYTRGAVLDLGRPADNIYVIGRDGHEVQITAGNASEAGVFTPDGRSVVFSAMVPDGVVSLFELPATGGGLAHRLTFDNGPQISADVSSDGRTLAFNRDQSVRLPVIGGGGGAPRKLSSRHETLLSVLAAPDGVRLVCDRLGVSGSEIVVLDPRDGSERVLVAGSHPFLSPDGTHVLFAPRGADTTLASIALDGGAVEHIATLPGVLGMGVAAVDGIHLELRGTHGAEPWLIGPDRAIAREDGDGLVIPAPSGGWRAVRRFENGYHVRFIAPDGTASAHELVAESERPTWLDAHRFAYAAGGSFHIVDVTTGAEVATLPGPRWGEHAVLAADGTHWYDIQAVGRVTRHLMVNFDRRPGQF